MEKEKTSFLSRDSVEGVCLRKEFSTKDSFHLWLLPFPLEETGVPTWGNWRSHLGKPAFLTGGTVVPACGDGQD